MIKPTLVACLAIFLIAGCNTETGPSEPTKRPIAAQQAEIEKTKREVILAECALYRDAAKKSPKVRLPEQCL